MNRRAQLSHCRRVSIVLGALLGACGGAASIPPGGAGGAPTSASAGGAGPRGGAGPVGGAAISSAMGGAAGTGGSGRGMTGGSDDAGPTTDGSLDTGVGGSLDASAGADGDASVPPKDASGSSKILIYGVTTGYRHASIPAAADAMAKAALAVGLTAEQVGCTDATNRADATKFTAAALAEYGAVILLANSGEPFGYPATQEIQNLVDYVQNGGALVAIEDASHCYDGSFNGHPASQPYVALIGADFVGHPGDVSPATCTKMGAHPSVVQLPAGFGTTDEVYEFSQFRTENQVVLQCTSSGDPKRMVRPVSWARDEGKGRYFFTALGHLDASWTAPMDARAANTRLVEDHVLPGLLWAMRR